eukprot:CAMPEP_0196653472 /NCGR_PEP_ID=MMETSP1086-20130531/3102_1 /TAXON_ID=77921 /ORGANISM="Cyanoptyche  gloeocystis , Strain SAG4.97" /LENGTH=75 /DNA_ID=CAMNT_0041984689 /DNA_START=252 /DNA_END=479 /DNA_ORIENTATION=-
MLQAAEDAGLDDQGHEGVQSERGADNIADPWVVGGGSGGNGGDVLVPVPSRRKEERRNHDSRATSSDTCIESVWQ